MYCMIPVPTGRFKVLSVDRRQSIKEFIRRKNCSFKTGRGFYQLTKTELVQGNKEVVLVDKLTGEVFTGSAVRKVLGLPDRTAKKSFARRDVLIDPQYFENYTIFIQSTSHNRVLIPATKLLYEVEGWYA